MTTKPDDPALPSRRAMMGALAALPVAGVPVLAQQPSQIRIRSSRLIVAQEMLWEEI